MNRLIIAVCFAAISAGCAAQIERPEQCGTPPTPEQAQKAVDAYVAKVDWKDSESVRVRNVRSGFCMGAQIGGLLTGGSRMTGWEVDFEVNAKNSYGGYTGFEARRLLITPDGTVHWSETF
jgi:hypothetical protein